MTSQVRVLVAHDDLRVHQVVEDIVGICFKDVEVERVMSCRVLWEKLRLHSENYDLVLLGQELRQHGPVTALAQLLTEFPLLRKRLVVISQELESERDGPEAEANEVPCVRFPFSLDEFVEIVTRVYQQSAAEAARDEIAEKPSDVSR